MDDKHRLALASLAFLFALILFVACLVLSAGVVIQARRPVGAALATPLASQPSSDLTSTPALTATLPFSGTLAVTQGLIPVSSTPTPSLTPTITSSPTFASFAQDAWCIPWNAPASSARVVNVIDAVNIEVDLNGEIVPVRYIGVDLLEFGDDASLWQRMTDKNRELVGGKTVLLIKDRSETDSSGRLLRYVLAQGVFANLELVSSGYAVAASAPPDQSCDALFLEAEEQAIQTSRGLWAPDPTATRILMPSPSPTPLTTGPMVIGLIIYRGEPWQEPDEFVEVLNDGTAPIQLKGWTLSDDDKHVFTFPSFVLGPGQHCRIYTNQYHPTTCGFSFFKFYPIWDNDQDCAYLKDPLGETISTYCYY